MTKDNKSELHDELAGICSTALRSEPTLHSLQSAVLFTSY